MAPNAVQFKATLVIVQNHYDNCAVSANKANIHKHLHGNTQKIIKKWKKNELTNRQADRQINKQKENHRTNSTTGKRVYRQNPFLAV